MMPIRNPRFRRACKTICASGLGVSAWRVKLLLIAIASTIALLGVSTPVFCTICNMFARRVGIIPVTRSCELELHRSLNCRKGMPKEIAISRLDFRLVESNSSTSVPNRSKMIALSITYYRHNVRRVPIIYRKLPLLPKLTPSSRCTQHQHVHEVSSGVQSHYLHYSGCLPVLVIRYRSDSR